VSPADDARAAAPLSRQRRFVSPEPGETLEALAARYAVVAVISGRPVDYLAEQLGTRLRLAGLYGLESMIEGERVSADGAERWRAVVDGAVETATGRFGSLVEHKGLSMTVHFRTKPELEGDIKAWAAKEHQRSGLELRLAKASIELHPPVEFDKGTVVAAVAASLDNACFLGDDVGDLPAFAALDALRGRGVHVVKVGVKTAEAPAELLDQADLVVDGPAGALALLRTL
jgi:trehalose 6-phosphate phosphatase